MNRNPQEISMQMLNYANGVRSPDFLTFSLVFHTFSSIGKNASSLRSFRNG